jgi:16S rRNA (guanine527-N7)-methyltransferase
MKPDQLVRFSAELTKSSLFSPKLLTPSIIHKYEAYYQAVLKWNEFIPLTTIIEPVDFARKHILESIFAETFIPESIEEIWDIGSGLGVPGIPIAIIRPESRIFLIEANKKKSIFLKEIIHLLQIPNIKVLNERFESLPAFSVNTCVTSRALDDLKHLLPKILNSTSQSNLTLLLGTSELLANTQKLLISSNRQLFSRKIPKSTDRQVISISSCT